MKTVQVSEALDKCEEASDVIREANERLYESFVSCHVLS